MKKLWIIASGLVVVVALLAVLFITWTPLGREVLVATGPNATAALPVKHCKILHIMSYHTPWEWTDSQFSGFKDALRGLNVEYKVFQMDTKRKSSEEWKQKTGAEARSLIDSWQPDLVYTSDDDVQKYVVTHYINAKIPFVFSAVNADPAEYGFRGSHNITGVLENEHFIQSIRLLKDIVPGVKRIAVITDDGAMWVPVIARMKAQAAQLSGVRFVAWDTVLTFAEYQRKLREYETRADAVAFLGIFSFRRGDGQNVTYQEVAKWTADHCRLPDVSFWKDRATYGTLCAVSVSGYEQGLAAGGIARSILTEGKSPSAFAMLPTRKGQPFINLARAKRLGVKVNSTIQLSSQVITKFGWEN